MEASLFSLWNGNVTRQAAQQEIGRLLSRRSPRCLFADLGRRRSAGGDSRVPHDVLITTCALFCRGRDKSEEIAEALRAAHLEPILFIGFRLFLLNKSKGTTFSISWSDHSFPNKHAWLSRFAGEFHDLENRELLSVAQLIHQWDPDSLWDLAKEDPSDLLLLNWFDLFWDIPPIKRALELLSPAESQRRQALSFWWLTFSIRGHEEDEEKAAAILEQLRQVPEAVLMPRLFEFLLSEPACPNHFLVYLAKPSRDALLRTQMRREELFTCWREYVAAVSLIPMITSRQRQDYYWNVMRIITEKGLKTKPSRYDGKNLDTFLSQLPERYLRCLQANLSVWIQTLHTACIDSMLRPQIFSQDTSLQVTAERVIAF